MLPVNHRWKPDGSGDVERIPGGPADELTPHQKQQVIGIQNTKFAISEYRDELNKMKTADYASPNARAKLESRYSAMILLSKEAFNLGVLNPNDRVILEEDVANPITFKGAILSKETLDEQTAQLDRIMGHMGDVSMQIRPQDAQKNTSAGAAASTPTRKIMTIKSGKDAGEYYQENGKWFKK